jgi:FAD/FMN-containing dehydrogenase
VSTESVTRKDARYATLRQGRNARFPLSNKDAASRIELCDTADDVANALQRAIDQGLRPTVRSGGHCYEDFVSTNPNGVILDLSLLTGTNSMAGAPQYRIGAGTQLGSVYTNLYKRYGVTIPGGSCTTVAAGGHICGGGYGLLSRLHGLTSDWLTAVDIVTVDRQGKVIQQRIDREHNPDLLRACRGAGGGNFGIVTNYFFEDLPPAPQEVMIAHIAFAWRGMTSERFADILNVYGHYWETRGSDPDTWGLFTLLGLTHRSSEHFGIYIQFCNPDGFCRDLSVLYEFLNLFKDFHPLTGTPTNMSAASGDRGVFLHNTGPSLHNSFYKLSHHLWLDATVRGGGGGRVRGKYKSSYMKRSFTPAETACIYKYLTHDVPGADLSQTTISVDSYGGAINRKQYAEETSIPQRSSVMKLQFLILWDSPEDDAQYLQWLNDFYTDLYSGPDASPDHKGTPYWNDRYEGCYINYPDRDMLHYPFWPQLYYGQDGLYPFLQSVKQHYDPNNIFHHAMSIRP